MTPLLDIDEVKQWLRLETSYTDEDKTLNTLIKAAEEYLKNATGMEFNSTNQLAKLFCLVLIADWFEDRQMVGKVSDKVRHTIESILMQLRYCYTSSESDET